MAHFNCKKIKTAIFTQVFPPFNFTLRGLQVKKKQNKKPHLGLVKALLRDAEILTCWAATQLKFK